MLENERHSPKTPSRGVLFDFDGTMGRSLSTWASAYGDALRHHGVDLAHDELIDCCFHRPQHEVIAQHGVADPHGFKELVWESVRLRVDEVDPYPHFVETLHALRSAGYRVAVVSNSRKVNIEPVLVRWGIYDLFDAIVTIDDVTHGKPDPEAVHHALNRLNVSPSEAYIVGDSTVDIRAGHRAGIKTIAFSPDENWRFLALETLKETSPSHVVHSYRELRALLGADIEPQDLKKPLTIP